MALDPHINPSSGVWDDNFYAQTHGGGGGSSGGGVKNFNENFEDLFTKSYEALKPFYTKLLEYSKGDYNLAVEMLEETYKTNPEYLENLKKPEVKESIKNMLINKKVVEFLKDKIIK